MPYPWGKYGCEFWAAGRRRLPSWRENAPAGTGRVDREIRQMYSRINRNGWTSLKRRDWKEGQLLAGGWSKITKDYGNPAVYGFWQKRKYRVGGCSPSFFPGIEKDAGKWRIAIKTDNVKSALLLMVFLTACTGVWADTVTILIKEGSGRI